MIAHAFGPLINTLSRHVGIALGILAVLIWGGYLAFTRAGIVNGVSAHEMTLLRFAVAALIMLPWSISHFGLIKQHLTFAKALVLTLTAGPLFILLGAGGYEYAPLALGATIQPAAISLTGIFLGTWLLAEKLTSTQTVGVFTLIIGTCMVAFYDKSQVVALTAQTLQGMLMFVGAGILWALFSYFCKRWAIPPLVATATVASLSAMVYVPIYLWTHGITKLVAIPAATLITQAIVQGVLSGVIAVLAYSKVVQIMGVSKASMFPALVPSVAVLFGVLLVDEIPTFLQCCGVIVSLFGFTLINRMLVSKTQQGNQLKVRNVWKSI